LTFRWRLFFAKSRKARLFVLWSKKKCEKEAVAKLWSKWIWHFSTRCKVAKLGVERKSQDGENLRQEMEQQLLLQRDESIALAEKLSQSKYLLDRKDEEISKLQRALKISEQNHSSTKVHLEETKIMLRECKNEIINKRNEDGEKSKVMVNLVKEQDELADRLNM